MKPTTTGKLCVGFLLRGNALTTEEAIENAKGDRTVSTDCRVGPFRSMAGILRGDRVKSDSPTDGPGDDWDHAWRNVIEGLSYPLAGDEVWVARGTYLECITLKDAVKLYGGLGGTPRWVSGGVE